MQKQAFPKKKVAVFGATGSVGQTTLQLLQEKSDYFSVELLTANDNAALLAEYAIKFGAKHVVIAKESRLETLQNLLQHTDIEVRAGGDALVEAAAIPVNITIGAIVGIAGLEPLMESLKQGNILALANKESLVCAGTLFMQRAKEFGTTLIPIDSEHNAIFQLLEGHQRTLLDKIILTASGGSFREYNTEQLRSITPKQATQHPNWDMGAKITIDSSTMFNKGLEAIEAHYLFDLPAEQIDIIVHPESVIHGMVGYKDGSMMAHMGISDMKIPVAHALGWPERMAIDIPSLDLVQLQSLHFYSPDLKKFPLLAMALEVMRANEGGSIALNAANEVAVDAFLHEKIGFMDIALFVQAVLERNAYDYPQNLCEILEIDQENRQLTEQLIRHRPKTVLVS